MDNLDIGSLMQQFQPTEQDRQRALTQALLSASMAAFGGSGNGWQVLSQAGQAGLGNYNASLQNVSRQRRSQMHDAMEAYQLRGLAQNAQDDQAAREVLQQYQPPQMPAQGVAPKTAAQFGVPGEATNSGFSNLPPAPQAAQPTGQSVASSTYARLNALANSFEKHGLIKQAMQYRIEADKYAPKYTGTKTVMQDGVPVLMQEYANQAPSAVQGFQPTPDTQFVDLGGRLVAVDKNRVSPGTDFTKTMSPGETASNKLGWANYGLTSQRLGLERAKADVDNTKLQFITDNSGKVYAMNPRTGQGALARGPDGQPLTKGDKPLTEVQGNATAFGMRMKAANDIVNHLEDTGFDLSKPSNLLANNRVTNYAASPEAQAAYEAKLNFMTASLRKESGAAISKSEFDNEDKKYFPQPGDSKQVITQKRQMREIALQTMAAQAGPGAKHLGTTGGWQIRQVR